MFPKNATPSQISQIEAVQSWTVEVCLQQDYEAYPDPSLPVAERDRLVDDFYSEPDFQELAKVTVEGTWREAVAEAIDMVGRETVITANFANGAMALFSDDVIAQLDLESGYHYNEQITYVYPHDDVIYGGTLVHARLTPVRKPSSVESVYVSL